MKTRLLFIYGMISACLLIIVNVQSLQAKDDELLRAYYNPKVYNQILERGVRRLTRLVKANQTYARLRQFHRMRFVFSLNKQPLHGIEVNGKEFIASETVNDMNQLLAEMAAGNTDINIHAMHLYVAVMQFYSESTDPTTLKEVEIKNKKTLYRKAVDFLSFKRKLINQIFRRGLAKNDQNQGDFGAVLLVSKEVDGLIKNLEDSNVKPKITYDVQLATGKHLVGAISKIRKKLYKYQRKGGDLNPYNKASFFNNEDVAFRYHIVTSCEEFLWNDYAYNNTGSRFYEGTHTLESAIRQKPLLLLANPSIKGNIPVVTRSEYMNVFGKLSLAITATIAMPVLLEYATVHVGWKALAAQLGREAARKGLTEGALHAALEASIMYYFEGKSLPDIQKHLTSAKFIKEAALASAQGLFTGKLQDAAAAVDILGCADIDLGKGKISLKEDCLMNALGAYLLSKALSGNYAERLQKVFGKHRDKFVDGLARLGFACQHIERIAATLNLQIKGTELCSLVDARRKKKGYTKKYKEGKGKGKDKKGGAGKTTHELIVKKEGLEWVARKVTRKKSKGKGKTKKGGQDKGEVVSKAKSKDKLLTFSKLSKGGTGKFSASSVIKKMVQAAKAEGVLMPNTSPHKNAIRAWAKSAGCTEVKVSNGVKFIKAPEAFITKAGTGNKQTWKLYASKTAKEQNKQPIIVAEYITVNAQDDKQALKIVSIQSPKQDQAKKQRWLTALFEAVVKNKASDGKASPTKRSVSVITAKATAGINLNAFKGLKEQDKIDKEGQKTLVGKWAANLRLAGKPQEYKYTLVRNDHIRFAKTACFVAGTKVWLHDYSQKNIEDVLPQDTVRAFDASLGQEVLGRVTHTMVKQSSTLIGVYTATDTLWVTPEHPFYVNGKWIPAGSLKKGNRLTLLNHNQLMAKARHLPRSAQVRIDSIAVKDTVATVYNFTVAKHHNYYVGNVGVLVHNKLCLVEKFTHDQVEYHVFRDDVSGSVHVKFNTGQTKPNGKPKLDRVGRGSIGDGTKKYPGKEKGMLSVEVNVKDGQGNDKHPKVKGNFVLQTIIKYELKEGKTLTSFKATWSGKLRTNLDMYNEGISDGLSKKEAANNTWTGDWFWKNYKLACREDKDVSIKAERDGANVTVVFRKSNTRATGVFVRKIGREWVAYSSSQKKKVLGKGKYDKNKKSLEIIIENAGKMRVDAICSGLVARIKKMARNGKDPVRRVFMTDKKYLAGLPLYLAKRWYVTTKGLEALKKHVREKRVRIADWAFRQKYNFLGLSKDKSGKPTAIYFSKENDFAPKTLVHYTTKEAYEGILKSKVLFPSTKKGHTTFGQGQYFTDIHPSDIGGFRKKDLTQSQINEGLIAAESIAMSTWGQNKRTHLMTHYVVVDVSNIPLEKSSTKGGYQIYLKKNKRYNLNIAGLIRAKGLTPYCTPHVTKKVGAKEEVWQLYASKLHTEPQIKARYVFLGKEKKSGALYIDEVKNPEGQGKSQKKAWLTQLFAAVLSGDEKNTGDLPAKTREISVIVALPKAGIKMSDFSSIRSESQDKINNKGKETLVGAWAADILLGKTHHNYKYTIIRNNSIRFAKAACFVAGTKVWLHDYSQKNIEDVLPQDTVRAFDTTTGQEVLGKVTQTIIKQSSTLIGVYTAIDTLWVTPEHPFYVNGKWTPAGSLKKGNRLTLLNHNQLLVKAARHLPRSTQVRIDSIVVKDTVATVYNFTVAHHHNYYVGNSGVLVHNDQCVESDTGMEVGVVVGREKNNRLVFHLEEYVFDPSKKIDLKSFAKLAVPGEDNIPNNQNILYFDLDIPNEINQALRANREYLGKVSIGYAMFTDGYNFYTNKTGKSLDGIYGEWIKSDEYKDYGGESLNLKRFREALEGGATREEAAFATITGKWAASKGYNKVEFVITPDPKERVEVIFRK